MKPGLTVKELSKTYPGVRALDHVNIDFYPGEVHALLGENGAGKSTLCKLLSGAQIADEGQIVVEGKTYKEFTPDGAKKAGISMIYQELNLIEPLAVYENIFLGREVQKGLMLDKKYMIEETNKIFEKMKIKISPVAEVRSLSIAYKQLVEIAKALSENAKILIMDEPTAPLTENEVEVLFELIGNLKEQGVTLIYISHRIEELFQIAEKVTVMRDGQTIKTLNTKDTNRTELINMMCGREINDNYYEKVKISTDEVVLSVRNLTTTKVKNISFDLHKGEVLGLGGLVGAGRTETVRAIFGADALQSGEIVLHGKKMRIRSPKDAINNGIALIPEDRKLQGCHVNLNIQDNITLPIIHKLTTLFTIRKKEEKAVIDKYINTLSIKAPTVKQLLNFLSGGNQQKVVVSKWLAAECEVLMLDEPTRGIDIGAKHEIYSLINKLKQDGHSIIVVSSELLELIGICDRVVVLYEGEKMGEVTDSEMTQQKILALASGGDSNKVEESLV